MTLAEINAVIKGYNQERETDARLRAIIAHRQASLTAVAMWDGKKMKSPQEAFPEIFGEQNQNTERQDWRVMKAHIKKLQSLRNGR